MFRFALEKERTIPRKKPDTALLNVEKRPRPPWFARYFTLALTEIERLYRVGDETAAIKLQDEIADQASFQFSGVALSTIQATISWMREREHNLPSDGIMEFPPVEAYADIAENREEVVGS